MTLYKTVSTMISILIVTAILMVTPSMAKDQRKTIHLSDGATINGTVLKPGDYTIEFSNTEAGEATIRRNGKVILRAPYKLVALLDEARRDEVRSRINSDGTQEITQLVFGGSAVAVVFE